MAKDDSGLDSCVVVVGDPESELVQTVARSAHAGKIEAVLCDNVYSAVARMAQAAGRRILVVGPIAELARENGAFFRIAAAHAVRCCCLLDNSGSDGREGDPHRDPARLGTQDLLAALQAGVTMLGDVQDVRGVLQEWLATAPSRGSSRVGREASPAKRRARDAAGASYEDLRATEAELSALLG
jgi:hypothetical protein